MSTIREVIECLEKAAPPALQESYDNAGLITGDAAQTVTGVLVCLDSTEAVVDEAIARGCNLVVAHHPIVFSGLKKITGRTYVERTLIKAIRHGIAIYAIHTNLDNVLDGVNAMICSRLGITKTSILVPRKGMLRKLITFCPHDSADTVRNALFAAGAGQIGRYDECSFNTEGTGTFRPMEGANPTLGKHGQRHSEKEIRLETLFESYRESAVLSALKSSHPYEEVAYDIVPIENAWQDAGSGMIGTLEQPENEAEFLLRVKKVMQAGVIKHTAFLGRPVQRVAVCGGSGSFLLGDAIRQGADVFITSDFKYHQFFDADGKIVIADIGHYESEQYTKELIYALLMKNFSTFALRLSEVKTNPVHYC